MTRRQFVSRVTNDCRIWLTNAERRLEQFPSSFRDAQAGTLDDYVEEIFGGNSDLFNLLRFCRITSEDCRHYPSTLRHNFGFTNYQCIHCVWFYIRAVFDFEDMKVKERSFLSRSTVFYTSSYG